MEPCPFSLNDLDNLIDESEYVTNLAFSLFFEITEYLTFNLCNGNLFIDTAKVQRIPLEVLHIILLLFSDEFNEKFHLLFKAV